MRKIVKKFPTAAGEVTVLKGINATFEPAEFVGVVGKSGSGKSTLVNMLTGIDRPTSGEVRIGDTLVHRLNESEMSRWRGLNLGIIFQFYQLLPVLSLLENTMLPMDIAGRIPPAERETRALHLLRMVGLEEAAHKMPSAVSGGQQQAAAIARALANDPPFLVADEPTGSLDSRTAEQIFHIFEGLVEQGKTIIVVTHDPQLARRTSRKLLLCDGEIVHPAIAAGLPGLSHTQMLRVTRHSREIALQPGQPVTPPGQALEGLYFVLSGSVDVHPAGNDKAAHLGPGQAFGAAALPDGLPAAVSAAASGAVASEPAELLAVEAGILHELAAEPSARRAGLARPQAASS